MALQGDLRDMAVADLIQHNCQESRTARLELLSGTGKGTAVLFLEGGQVVHASMRDQEGEEVVFEVLDWEDGAFNLELGVAPPKRTIHSSYTTLLLEGLRRHDERDTILPLSYFPEKQNVGASAEARAGNLMGPRPSERLIADIRAIEGVNGVVFAAQDGVVIAQALEGHPEKEAAVAVFVGYAAKRVGQSLGLGELLWGTVAIGKETFMIVEQPDYYIGILLQEGSSPALVSTRVEALLRAGA